MSNPRADLLEIYRAALAAVRGDACVQRLLTTQALSGEVYAVAVGKAAGAMLAGARRALGEQLRRALLITKTGHLPADAARLDKVTALEAGHPLPDGCSLAAGRALLDFIAATPEEGLLLFLISGGASSLAEVPPPGVSLGDLRRVNEWLLASGWDISKMNALRKHLSLIKGGRLAAYVKGQRVMQLLISDVPGDRVADIGSGMLVAAEETAIAEDALPVWLRAVLRRAGNAPSSPRGVETHLVATLDDALCAAAAAARDKGYAVHGPRRLSGDAADAGRTLARTLTERAPGIYLWGGETTVHLPARPGRGGRNQHFALAAAEALAGCDKVWLLAAGTDGSDGPGEDAGALVDGGTVARGELEGLNAADCLRRADAGAFLEASGDLITTGPTGTNVMDLVMGFKSS